MLKNIKWYSDTCQCIHEFNIETDDVNSIPIYIKTVSKCNVHTILSDVDSFTNALEQNQRKQKLQKYLLDNFSILGEIVEGSLRWKSTITPSFVYSGTGTEVIITFSVTGISLTNAQKNTIRNWCTTNFGSNKVTVL